MAASTDTTNAKPATVRKAAPASTTIYFSVDRETKGTFRYAEEGDDPIVGTLYVRKPAYNKLGGPQRLKVVLSAP